MVQSAWASCSSSPRTLGVRELSIVSRRPCRPIRQTKDTACSALKVEDTVNTIATVQAGTKISPVHKDPLAQVTSSIGSNELHLMPLPVDDLLESACELAIDAAFADKRAMLELSGYEQGYARPVEAAVWSRMSATRQAEPCHQGYSYEMPSTTIAPPPDRDEHLARFLALPRPMHSTRPFDIRTTAMPTMLHKYLQKQAPFLPPPPPNVSKLSRSEQYLANMSPVGLKASDLSLCPVKTSLIHARVRTFLAHYQLAVLWRKALFSLLQRGILTRERLDQLGAQAHQLSAVRFITYQSVVMMCTETPVTPRWTVDLASHNKGIRKARHQYLSPTQSVVDVQSDVEAIEDDISSKDSETLKHPQDLGMRDESPEFWTAKYRLHFLASIADNLQLVLQHVEHIMRQPISSFEVVLSDGRFVSGKTGAARPARTPNGVYRQIIAKQRKMIASTRTFLSHTTTPTSDRPVTMDMRSRQRNRHSQHTLAAVLIGFAACEEVHTAQKGIEILDFQTRATFEAMVCRPRRARPSVATENLVAAAMEQHVPDEQLNAIQAVQEQWNDAMAKSRDGALSRETKHAFTYRLFRWRRHPGRVGLLSTVDWRRHKHKVHKRKKKLKRSETERDQMSRRARKERIRQYTENLKVKG